MYALFVKQEIRVSRVLLSEEKKRDPIKTRCIILFRYRINRRRRGAEFVFARMYRVTEVLTCFAS